MDTSTTKAAREDPPAHLTLIVDLNPLQWELSSQASNDTPLSLSQFLAQLMIFINAHLAARDDNTLAVIGALPGYSVMLYSTDDSPPDDEAPARHQANSFQPFRMVDGRIASRIQEEMEKSTDLDGKTDRGLVGAITKALCHINRVNLLSVALTNNPESTSAMAPPSSQSPRMLILSISPDASTSYIPLMNSIFAAQKLKVKIDVCKIFGSDTVFLQQAAYLTGGSYLVLERRDALLQYLSMCFLPPASLRKVLATPSQDKVDFRAACFCHKKVVDIGCVCSVCLSIFCYPITRTSCSTCGTRFPLQTLKRLGYIRQPAAQANGRSKPNGTANGK
ncbi:hypothetical protein M407DRAFT_66889 [Tulasnella calospora MUT 4182]|uniref:General transcription and DNA repair factor IIH subunit TFB4 n=1 Tax=Tulasnella calospora MUT 4182 TaxID=1051891 RepID=A0A0C3QT20_9AGAM|nr:hypothetical protein M407DRAFT_66889 [Tulasnella calospora MUT 4182]